MTAPTAEKKAFYIVSPELSDGVRPAVHGMKHSVIAAVKEWLDDWDTAHGVAATIEIVQMTEEEVDALPDI